MRKILFLDESGDHNLTAIDPQHPIFVLGGVLTTQDRRIESLTLRTKQDRIAGLEIADAVVTPIARRLLGRKSRVDLDVIKDKMRKNNMGDITGHGLVVLPKK